MKFFRLIFLYKILPIKPKARLNSFYLPISNITPIFPSITPFSSSNFSKHSHIWKGGSSSQNNVEKKGWILSTWINNLRSYSLNNQPSYRYHKDPVLHKWSVHLWRSNRVVPPLAHQLAATLFIRTTSKILLPPTTKSVFCKKRPLKATYLWATMNICFGKMTFITAKVNNQE